MRKKLAIALASFALAASGGVATAQGNACPEASHNPGGTPPNCGQAPPCPDGIVTGPADELTEGNLNDLLCAVHEGVEDATGIPA